VLERTTTAGVAGRSLVDLLFAIALMAIIASTAMASFAAGTTRLRSDAAARHVAQLLREARARAVRDAATVAVRVEGVGERSSLRAYRDGNGNGIRTTEIAAGTDPAAGAAWRMTDEFPGVTFRVPRDVPAIDDAGTIAAGSDPVRLGPADLVSFSPLGTSSSGTVYLAGRDGVPYGVRVLGATARIRILAFDAARDAWVER